MPPKPKPLAGQSPRGRRGAARRQAQILWRPRPFQNRGGRPTARQQAHQPLAKSALREHATLRQAHALLRTSIGGGPRFSVERCLGALNSSASPFNGRGVVSVSEVLSAGISSNDERTQTDDGTRGFLSELALQTEFDPRLYLDPGAQRRLPDFRW